MKQSNPVLPLLVLSSLASFNLFASPKIDMDDPHRALGREDDVRVDAQLLTDTVTTGRAIGVVYQIQNLTKNAIAVAEKKCTGSYDAETRTITLAIGSEVPVDGTMPRMAIVAPGETKTFTAGASVRVATAAVRSPLLSTPRYVQIKVSVLRDTAPFADLIAASEKAATPIALSDAQFEHWLEANDTIFLNPLPVQFDSRPTRGFGDISDSTHSSLGMR